MPFYEYQCKNCDHEFDELQKFSDPPLVECPACSKKSLEKKISAPGFQLTGTGWYETDFKDKKPQKTVEAENAADGQSEKSVENKVAENKTAPLPEKKTKQKTKETKSEG